MVLKLMEIKTLELFCYLEDKGRAAITTYPSRGGEGRL